ncbi:hypothetical protein ASD97_26000 [Streptomyces sp. Root63]|uniref:hypothetical protein n=1 Tax=unclassified Streptomyces TaxID=2593676 RepID=UPI0006F89076|nr:MULTISPECIES: hypothetical protein [unclassified Streptomyces]KQX43529.1 hypothetical protein ASD29_32305 [Streptomyces sp. Root1295]KRA34092.1 hypothetical protein ASD97_26000 [Streptomyces sp. Root63]
MPVISGLTDALLVKSFHRGLTDKAIAEEFGISVQAVSKRRMKLGLVRKPISRKVNEGLAARWSIWAPKEGTGHHNAYSAKALKVWLRMRLGDATLSAEQKNLALQWEGRLRDRETVLCYDPNRSEGWYYRPRTERDGRLVIDWPGDLPFPSEEFKRALELPPA